MDWNSLLFVVSYSTVILAPQTAFSQCPSPDKMEVKQSLVNSIKALLPESTDVDQVMIWNFNIVCYAVKGLDSYNSVSVVTNSTQIINGVMSKFIYRFQMKCDSDIGWIDSGEGLIMVDASYLTLEPKHDCFECTFMESDPVYFCKPCAPECADIGSGSCLTTKDDCCSYFNPANGSCVDNCTALNTNFAPNPTSYICECILECPPGTTPDDTCSQCIDSHICLTSNPCKNGGTCNIGTGNNYTCSCAGMASGMNCSECLLLCKEGTIASPDCTICEVVDICKAENPCQNGGSCTVTDPPNGFLCECDGNFLQPFCADCGLSCENGRANDGCSKCDCDQGFSSQGKTCEPIKPCEPNPCLNGGTCTEGEGLNYTCLCPANFIGMNCSSCKDRYGFSEGYCTVCRDEYCENCSSNANKCNLCSSGYVFDDTQQCVSDGFPTELLIWILVGCILGVLLLTVIFCAVVFGMYKCAAKEKYSRALKNAFKNSGSAVTNNPLYISEEELLQKDRSENDEKHFY